MMRLRMIPLLALLALTGCNKNNRWQPYDAAGVPFARGSAACKYEASVKSQSGAVGMAGLPQADSDIYVMCMLSRGY